MSQGPIQYQAIIKFIQNLKFPFKKMYPSIHHATPERYGCNFDCLIGKGILTYSGLVTPFGHIDLDQHWLR